MKQSETEHRVPTTSQIQIKINQHRVLSAADSELLVHILLFHVIVTIFVKGKYSCEECLLPQMGWKSRPEREDILLVKTENLKTSLFLKDAFDFPSFLVSFDRLIPL